MPCVIKTHLLRSNTRLYDKRSQEASKCVNTTFTVGYTAGALEKILATYSRTAVGLVKYCLAVLGCRW